MFVVQFMKVGRVIVVICERATSKSAKPERAKVEADIG